MYTCLHAFSDRRVGKGLGCLFALFAVFSSFGMGNMTQSNAISEALLVSFGVEKADSGLAVTILTILVVLGGIGVIGRVTQVLVPFVGIFYLLGTLGVILTHLENLPAAAVGIIASAFQPQAFSGGLFGSITVSAF